MKKLSKITILATIVIFSASCVSWQQAANITLSSITTANDTVNEVVNASLNNDCKAAAVACYLAQDQACPALVECQKKRDTFNKYSLAVYQGILATTVAMSLADENTVESYIIKTQKLLMELYNLVTRLMPETFPELSEEK